MYTDIWINDIPLPINISLTRQPFALAAMKWDNTANNHDGPPSKFQHSSVDLINVSTRCLIPRMATG